MRIEELNERPVSEISDESVWSFFARIPAAVLLFAEAENWHRM